MREYFKETKYINLYFKIIDKSKDRKRLRKDNPDYIYYEGHHILPKSLFPEYSNLNNNKWNKSILTAREHFICHILLMKHYKSLDNKNEYNKMSFALRRMKNSSNNSKSYSLLRLNLEPWNKGKKGVSEETSKKMSEAKKDYKPWNTGIKTGQKVWNKDIETGPMKEETKDKISNSLKETFKENGHHLKGKAPWNKGVKTGKEAWNKGKKMETVICPHCDKEGSKTNMKRWHFNNCKTINNFKQEI